MSNSEPLISSELARDGDFIQSLERGLNVLQSLAVPGMGSTLTQVSDATGLSRAAARRFLITLVRLGYARTDGHQFALTPKVLRLGYAYLSGLGIPELTRTHLERLSSQVNESSAVAVLDDNEVVYVARVTPPTRAMSLTVRVGTRLPAYATSLGRVLLADLDDNELKAYFKETELKRLTAATVVNKRALLRELDRVREQGWAMVDGEREDGIRSVAAPLRDSSGRVLAAVNLSVLAARTPVETLKDELLPKLLHCAAAIEADLAADVSYSPIRPALARER